MKNLGFGLMRLPLLDPNDAASIDIEQMKQMVDEFIANGFTYFDTAYMYHKHQSENAVREALTSRHDRSSYTITSKLPIMSIKSADEMEKVFNEQLQKCGVDYFDYYLVHNVNRNDIDNVNNFDAFGFVLQKKAEGKVRHVGFSFHDTAEMLDEVLTAHPEVEFVQLQINYLDWEHAGVQSRLCYETARRHGKSIIIMEPVKGGTLANVPAEAEALMRERHPDMSPASWAIRFAASHEGVMMVLSGMSNLDQLHDNMSYMKNFKPLDDEEMRIIEKVTDIVYKSILIQCTGCEYCVEKCPAGIPIPKYFSLYNLRKQGKLPRNPDGTTEYDEVVKTNAKASDCLKCGVCESLCPQHIEIRGKLENVAKTFEK